MVSTETDRVFDGSLAVPVHGPVASSSRIEGIDVLRGLALFGVIIIHVVFEFRVSIFQPSARAGLVAGAAKWYGWRPSANRVRLLMRALTRLLFAVAMMLSAASARAQTYDPNYPVCLQTFGRMGNAISCGFTSMEQCRWSASGRAAQCITNPYFAGANTGRIRRHYRIP